MRTGIANLPLHYGNAPRWLFQRMERLSAEIATAIIFQFGPKTLLERLADPFWFQAFGCVLGFDWHSSGLTTTVCGALKSGLSNRQKSLNFYVCGGKGKTSRKTPQEIMNISECLGKNLDDLVYASKMSAKVDNSALQDGYQLYHHTFFFTLRQGSGQAGKWAVVQQGMRSDGWARRYHWLSDDNLNFVQDPHQGILGTRENKVLNLVAKSSLDNQNTIAFQAKERPEKTIKLIKKITTLNLPNREQILLSDISKKRLAKILLKTYEKNVKDFEEVLATPGVGPKTLRALSLIGELIYKKPAANFDPVTFSFAHGGKDGYPYPVERNTYDQSIHFMADAIKSAKLGRSEKLQAFQRLSLFPTQ